MYQGCKLITNLDDCKIYLQSKTEMLANLLDIEVAYSLLKGGDGGDDPIDAHYKKLQTAMKVRKHFFLCKSGVLIHLF